MKTCELQNQTVVKIEIGARSYNVHIGRDVQLGVGKQLKLLLPNSKFFIVTDENVAEIHLKKLIDTLKESGISCKTAIIAPGEGSKSFSVYEDLCERILAAKLDRSDAIIAFGGGVVGDIAGFVTSTLKRGINLVQIPTSLLAQVDSSVGGKTGINTRHGKNLIGTFYQPLVVFADTKLLESISKREFKAGYAEVVKYGLINDENFFSWLEKNWNAIFAGGKELDEAVAYSCQSKASFVRQDEKESGMRALLNLGHTFGHALEVATKYETNHLIHGEGVAIGMCMAFEYSEKLNLCQNNDTQRVKDHLAAVGLPTSLNQIPCELPPAEEIMNHIYQDKKVNQGNLKLILVRGVGQAFIENEIEQEHLLNFLKEKIAA